MGAQDISRYCTPSESTKVSRVEGWIGARTREAAGARGVSLTAPHQTWKKQSIKARPTLSHFQASPPSTQNDATASCIPSNAHNYSSSSSTLHTPTPLTDLIAARSLRRALKSLSCSRLTPRLCLRRSASLLSSHGWVTAWAAVSLFFGSTVSSLRMRSCSRPRTYSRLSPVFFLSVGEPRYAATRQRAAARGEWGGCIHVSARRSRWAIDFSHPYNAGFSPAQASGGLASQCLSPWVCLASARIPPARRSPL